MNSLISVIDLINCGCYIAIKGDTLDSVSKKFSTTKNAIKSDNFLDEDIKEGQLLFIKKHDIIHEVKVYETLEDISKKYGVSAQDILLKNGLEFIYPYARIIIFKNEND